jgi:hypothetical protein
MTSAAYLEVALILLVEGDRFFVEEAREEDGFVAPH